MTEEFSSPSEVKLDNWVSAPADGGLPQLIAGPAGKAISRLIGAGADIPVAYLEGIAQKTRDKTDARSAVSRAIADAAKQQAVDDPQLVQAALNSMMSRSLRAQANKASIAKMAIEDLSEEPPKPEATGPDEDWLNVVERYAEDVSNDQLQGLWGKVLAGEIRQSGSFSMRTLRFLAEFSRRDAENFEEIAQKAFCGHVPRNSGLEARDEDITSLIDLETSGLVQTGGGLGLMKSYSFNADGYIFLSEGTICLVLFGEPGTEISYGALALTPLGRELLCLVGARDVKDAAKALAYTIKSPQIHSAKLGVIVEVDGTEQIQFIESLWDKEE